MPRRKRYALSPPAIKEPPTTEYERSVSIQEDFVQPLAAEAEFVEKYTTEEGLDPVEAYARKGRSTYKNEAERALAVSRLLPHRSTMTAEMTAIHERRFTLWLQGVSEAEIGEIEDVDSSAVERSVRYSKSILPRDEVFRANAQHTANRAHLECSDDVSPAITALLTASNWKAKSAGLTQFRRTVGMEVPAGVNVLVDNRKQTAIMTGQSGASSFEEVMDRVRGKMLEEQRTLLLAAEGTDSTPEAEP